MPDVAGVIFDVSDQNAYTLGFSVGTLSFNIPEPGSLALAGLALEFCG